jgi:hypothetical protein
LSLPGLAEGFTPHKHQRDAVWRVVSEPTALLAHAVGAGKTATMVMAAMELRRLGLARKPAIVVPNHMLEQFAREAKQLYPQADVLVAGKDEVNAEHRKAIVARCATGDWDIVVITHSAFERIPVSPEAQRTFIDTELADLRDAYDRTRRNDDRSFVKRLEKAIARRETRLEELLNLAGKDDGVTFEATGIDHLAVDEAHLFKNLSFTTRIQGLATSESQRAEDLDLKLHSLRQRGGKRVAVLATATPVANSIAELYVMQHYLQPKALDAAGISHFDGWAANFGATVTALELAPDGGSYRMNTRFARFRNVPDLLGMFAAVADTRTTDDLNLPTPKLDGGPQTVVVPGTDALRKYVASLVERAEAVRNRQVEPHEDNMLAVTGDGRRAALDLRLVDLPPAHPTKIEAAAERIAAIHHRHRDTRYLDPDTGRPADRPGALQLVFCDLGTPKPGHWSVYGELRDELVARGVPADAVRFVHDAKTDKAKAELFSACRDGRVAVLLGSTQKMGVGTNVQRRAIALHHLECPWRPADIEQREGRILRQGNQNETVEILRYATEGSFDIYSYQTVERKAAFINQVTRCQVTDREVDDVGDAALSFAEVKALATGNPLILEKAGVDAEAAKLRRLADAHRQDQARLRATLDAAVDRAADASAEAERLAAAIARRVDTAGDQFAMRVMDTPFSDRIEAGDALKAELRHRLVNRLDAHGTPSPLGSLGGLPLASEIHLGTEAQAVVIVADTPVRIVYSRGEVYNSRGQDAVRRIEHQIQHLERHHDNALQAAQEADSTAERARNRIGLPFPHQARLDQLRRRQAEIEDALTPAAPELEKPGGAQAEVPGPSVAEPPTAGEGDQQSATRARLAGLATLPPASGGQTRPRPWRPADTNPSAITR